MNAEIAGMSGVSPTPEGTLAFVFPAPQTGVRQILVIAPRH